ncbi:hypothetical protein [Rickettsia felis]|uniref:hypothetical protein n=1 Tax=Rickettsia felis TaxID=42862 RepID=UPI001584B8F1|nr:hypothetical protein [Rickettsia felis]
MLYDLLFLSVSSRDLFGFVCVAQCHSHLGGNPVVLNVTPWLDHGVQVFIFSWIP